MEDRDLIIKNYINNKARELVSNGIYINDEQINSIINKYTSTDYNVEDVIREIDKLVDEYIERFKRVLELREAYMKRIQSSNGLEDIPLEYSGITLNNQDIDLMNIEGAETPRELEKALEGASNISIDDLDLSNNDLVGAKEKAYRLYQDRLVDKNDYIRDPYISLRRKIEYLKESGELTTEELNILDEIINSSSNADEIIERINNSFEQDKIHRMYEIIKECTPVEKSGIKTTTPSATRNLIKEINNNYNSITIDQEAKYGSVALEDGTFDYRGLDKALDFAKKMDKQVRLNTILFYDDCPEKLYNLEINDNNKVLVKERLTSYVDSITKHIMENGYGDTVRSIDVFNELLNRFAMDGDVPYQYRGDIEQVKSSDGKDDDNIKSGWLKHLNVEDLCDVIAVARKNMPNVDFMYNDDNLEDPRKMEATFKLIQRIQEYEKAHGVKLIDSIGTQMHIDNSVSLEAIETMFRNLSKLGLPIEITEFDLAMTHGVGGLSPEQIEELRQQKISEILGCVNSIAKECNIRGFTIWSKTDSQNFRVSLANEIRIKAGLDPISTLHGGYYTESMESKGKQLIKNNTYRETNFHTHTQRCGHAGSFSDEEYIKAARSVGISTIGFSDHIPYTDMEYAHPEQRMHVSEVDEYVSSIEKLKQDNPDMRILSGFEAEYDPAKAQFLTEMRDKVDYMILGQHVVQNGLHGTARENNPEYPLEYAKSVCEAIDSGLYDIVAHPDIFMKYLNSMDSDEKKELFLRNSEIASRMICEKAKEMGIPVELNLAGVAKKEGYPDPTFWSIASEVGVPVVSGADAHNPMQLVNMALDEQKAEELIGNVPLNFVDRNYDPKIARDNNQKLQDALNRTRDNSVTYETYLVVQATNDYFSSKESESTLEEDCIDLANKMRKKATEEEPSKKVERIINSNLDDNTKKQKLIRVKRDISSPHAKEVAEKIRNTLESGAASIDEARTSGYKSRDEVINHVMNSMEARTQTDPQKRKRAIQSLEQRNTHNNEINQLFSTPPQTNKEPTKQESKPKVLRIAPPSSNNGSSGDSSGKKGFVESFSISLMMGMAFGIIVGCLILITLLS